MATAGINTSKLFTAEMCLGQSHGKLEHFRGDSRSVAKSHDAVHDAGNLESKLGTGLPKRDPSRATADINTSNVCTAVICQGPSHANLEQFRGGSRSVAGGKGHDARRHHQPPPEAIKTGR